MHQNGRKAVLTPAEQLAREWALFEAVESGRASRLHIVWEAARPVVVVGRSTPIPEHVRQDSCRAHGVAILRRWSGGGAVVLGPGCFNYAVVLSLVSYPLMADVAASFVAILKQVAEGLGLPGLSIAGGTDLSLHERKVSGNAQRRGRQAVIHHGTLLYDFDPSLAGRYLTEPVRQPAYRAGRSHAEFMGNVPLSRESLARRLEAALGTL